MTGLLIAAWLTCQSADLATTYTALHSGRFVEGNPFLRGPQLYALKVSVNVGMLIWHQQVKVQHPALIPIVMATAGCSAAAINLHSLKGPR